MSVETLSVMKCIATYTFERLTLTAPVHEQDRVCEYCCMEKYVSFVYSLQVLSVT